MTAAHPTEFRHGVLPKPPEAHSKGAFCNAAQNDAIETPEPSIPVYQARTAFIGSGSASPVGSRNVVRKPQLAKKQ